MQQIGRSLCDRYNPFVVILIALGSDRITDGFSCKAPLITAIPTGVELQSFGRGDDGKSPLGRSIFLDSNRLEILGVPEQTVSYSGNV
ncbi:MAG: hypothetical protein EA395_13160 [Phormidium sp. GEM2.Bin31]|nr:MAG: hypothetical protein EA395_13160 [Phormidium sp. GEM2.Bin31]